MARLDSGEKVRLELEADGGFRWSVESKEAVASFSGEYRLNAGQLTLTRSQDGNQLIGSWTPVRNGLRTFQLNGGNAGAIEFMQL